MEVFNMDQGNDLTATGGGIAEDGVTIALRTADKHPRNTPQRVIHEPSRMVRIFDHHTGMEDAMAYIMFLFRHMLTTSSTRQARYKTSTLKESESN
jgi:hypothetical protein